MNVNGSNYPGYNDSCDEQPELFRFIMYSYIAGPLASIGLLGNVVVFIIFGKILRRNAMNFLLRALSAIDNCLLLCMITYLYGFSAKSHTNGGIHAVGSTAWPFIEVFVVPPLLMALMANVWTSVIIGMNRYIAVCRPLHAASLCTTSQAKKQIMCVISVSVIYMLPRFFDFEIKKTTDGYREEKLLLDNKWYTYIYLLGCDITVRILTPFGLLLFFCVRLIAVLRATKKQPMNRHGGSEVDNRITSMLVFMLGIFLVCHAVNILHRVVKVIHIFHFCITWINTLNDILVLLIILNSSINSFIYFAYIKEFRKTLCGFICALCPG